MYARHATAAALSHSPMRAVLPADLEALMANGTVVTSARDAGSRLSVGNHDVELLQDEYTEVRTHIQDKLDQCRLTGRLTHPIDWGLGIESSLLLYVLVRTLRPSLVCETGVANGVSTTLILHALLRNGAGRLHSIDIAHDVGALVPDEQRHAWTLHVLDRSAPRRSFAHVVSELPQATELFLHDSDHSYSWQKYELETIWRSLAPRAVVLMDDAHASLALSDFCRARTLALTLLVESRKVMGIIGSSRGS
jgi:predicted O-methyltransferase YrrM